MPTRDAAGRFKYDRVIAPKATVVTAVGTTTTAGSTRTMEITEGEPNSGLMKLQFTNRWQRGDWDCTIEFSGEMTSTAEAFRLREWVIAKKGSVEIFRRETPSVIKRDLL